MTSLQCVEITDASGGGAARATGRGGAWREAAASSVRTRHVRLGSPCALRRDIRRHGGHAWLIILEETRLNRYIFFLSSSRK